MKEMILALSDLNQKDTFWYNTENQLPIIYGTAQASATPKGNHLKTPNGFYVSSDSQGNLIITNMYKAAKAITFIYIKSSVPENLEEFETVAEENQTPREEYENDQEGHTPARSTKKPAIPVKYDDDKYDDEDYEDENDPKEPLHNRLASWLVNKIHGGGKK